MDPLSEMKNLIEILNNAARAYYQEDREIISNLEYDRLYDRLLALEKETGVVLFQSPTVHVGYEVLSALEKIPHEFPMLSLDKTKEVQDLVSWLGERQGLLSWKLDGLTVVLTYEGGVLSQAVTRGNGRVGELITNNARVFCNLPSRIPWEGRLILRGEALINYSDFERINAEIEDVDARYKNPRNLCSGSVRQLNNEITARRNVHFYAFTLVEAQGRENDLSAARNLQWLSSLGFETVQWQLVTRESLPQAVQDFSEKLPQNDFPSDGLVLTYEDIAYGKSLGRTAKFPRHSIAFKWRDEEAETTLLEIEWSPSRTGLINPVAIFSPVELEGTTVSRASLHNLSIMDGLFLGIGDRIRVYKANMIIPQISENLTKSGNYRVIEHCPACGAATEIRKDNGVKTLYCPNPYCSAKKIKLFTHFVSRDAMNIDGLSEATLSKLIEREWISELYDLYELEQYKEEIIQMEGFGENSYQNLITAIERSKKTTLPRFLYGLGILNVGTANARLLCDYFEDSLEALREASPEEMTKIDGIGAVIAQSIRDYFDNAHNQKIVAGLLRYIHFEKRERPAGNRSGMQGKTFVITGSLVHFKNRKELKERIESLGGKVTGSVSAKTDYLINNDVLSSSSKNKKARELGIPVLSEEDFLERFNG